MAEKKVVITGMGVVSPNGLGVEEFKKSLYIARSGIVWIEELKNLGFNCQVGGLCNIDENIMRSKYPVLNTPLVSRSTFLLISSCFEAIENAGLLHTFDFESTKEYDLIVGSTIGAADLWGSKVVHSVDNGQHLKLGSSAFEQVINSSPAAMLAGILGLCGRVISLSYACASGTEAIIEATHRITYENKKVVIACGVEPYSKYYWATMDAMRITNPHFNESPAKASRPLSSSARGFVPAEGSAVLIIEDYEHAVKRGACILAEIIGSHINCGGQRDGGSMTATNKNKLMECLSLAIRDAGIATDRIDYISGHLTGTKSDPVEVEAWSKVLSDRTKPFPVINATKSLTGHTVGACGTIELVAAVLQMNNSFIHASVNCEDLHPQINNTIGGNSIPHHRLDDFKIDYLAKASFGFGDVNACLILKNPYAS
ncbi:MAG TPA: beta-ketoacyl-[acyl-carrier-protein] synthase family protein [Bacteroidales bacterium]|nr:beta-ketoacyl-[acyl-carrier-protein] synthase family protein [Bacteroidales bacterium]